MQSRIKYMLVLVAVVLLAVGTQQGDAQTVLQKAVNICLECIGVG